jgi:hypothetical protein
MRRIPNSWTLRRRFKGRDLYHITCNMLYIAIDSSRICLVFGRRFVKGVVLGVTTCRSSLRLFLRSLVLVRCVSLAWLFFLFHSRVPDEAAVNPIVSDRFMVGQA